MSADAEAAFAIDRRARNISPRRIVELTAFYAFMALVCWLSTKLPQSLGRVWALWPANAIALSLLLTRSRRRWPAWLAAAWAGNMTANMVAGDGAVQSLVLSACNLIEIGLAAVMLRRFVGPRLDVSRIGDLLRLALIAGLAAPLVSACIATLASALLGGHAGGGDWPHLESWVAANGLGAIITVPVVLTLRHQRKRLAMTPLTPPRWLALAALTLVTTLVFSVRQPMAFLIPPFILLVVFQLELLGAAWSILIVLMTAAALSATGGGLLGAVNHSLADPVLAVQLFMAAIVLTSFPTAAVLAHRRRLQATVTASAIKTAELYRRARLAEEIAGVGYWRVEPATGKVAWSETMYAVFGESTDLTPQFGHTIDRVYPDDRSEAARLIGRAVGLGEDQSIQCRIVRPDGEIRHILARASCERDAGGALVAVFGTVIDITELKQQEAELRAARVAAEAAAAVKGEFLANMSHELRTPLTSVLGFTHLALEQPDLTEASRGYITKASHAGAALLSTVNDILDFSKLESGRLQIHLEPCDPAEVCRETLELFSEQAAAKGLSLRFAAEPLPASLALDPNRLRQLLLNLIGNAVKFSEAGEIVLAAAWRADAQRLSVSVQDQGPGIAKAQQSLLFRRFSQVDGSSTRRHGGTGLGLAICMGLVEAMGGEIGIDSELGRGARFFFDIPAAPAAAAEAEAASETGLFPPGVRVLVADDHPANRELVRAVLVPLGAEVTEAENGAEALAAAERTRFDLILMDLRMPVLDGLGAMSAIRRGAGPNRATPILAFSAGADAPGAEARLQAGFDGDLSKPALPTDLIAAVCLYAGGGGAAAETEPLPAMA
jgi:PAS domain S-box-containing protein